MTAQHDIGFLHTHGQSITKRLPTAVCVIIALVTIPISNGVVMAGCVAGGTAVVAHVSSNTGGKHGDCNAEETQPTVAGFHRDDHITLRLMVSAGGRALLDCRTNGGRGGVKRGE